MRPIRFLPLVLIAMILAGCATVTRQDRAVLRAQQDIDETQIARVDLGLGGERRRRPAVQLRFGVLHRQVGALDETYLDVGAKNRVALRRPGQQLLGRRVRIGQVGLQDDARIEGLELVLGEYGAERVDREAKVAVLLHVEIDEDPVTLRRPVEQTKLGADPLQGAVVINGDQLAHDRRQLDRDVGHVLAAHHLKHAVQTLVGLAFAEHGLAEHVDVEAYPLAGPHRQVTPQRLELARQNEVLREPANPRVHDPHGARRSHARDNGDKAQTRRVEQSEPRHRCAPSGVTQDARGAPERRDAHHLIGEGHRDVDRVSIAQESREASAIGPLARSTQPFRVLDELTSPRTRWPGQGVQGTVSRRFHGHSLLSKSLRTHLFTLDAAVSRHLALRRSSPAGIAGVAVTSLRRSCHHPLRRRHR